MSLPAAHLLLCCHSSLGMCESVCACASERMGGMQESLHRSNQWSPPKGGWWEEGYYPNGVRQGEDSSSGGVWSRIRWINLQLASQCLDNEREFINPKKEGRGGRTCINCTGPPRTHFILFFFHFCVCVCLWWMQHREETGPMAHH